MCVLTLQLCFRVSLCHDLASNSSVAVETRATGQHGKHLWQPVKEPDRQKGDADSDGGAGCCRENHHPLQAEAGGDSDDHPHNWCVKKKTFRTGVRRKTCDFQEFHLIKPFLGKVWLERPVLCYSLPLEGDATVIPSY